MTVQPPFLRPSLRQSFRAFKLEPLIFFYTSNNEKYLHVKALLDRFGITLRHFPAHTEPYFEDYSSSKESLLIKAVTQVRERVGAGLIFFIEDTSVRIEALSSNAEDYPGLATKEWFGETTFAALDSDLRATGNDRRAIVKSDIALSLPGIDHPVLFHGETSGKIADTAPNFRGSPLHPWLTPGSFNGWFVPDGFDKPLGAMGLEESFPYDFRLRAIAELVSRFEEYYAALNLPSQAFRERPTRGIPPQLPLFQAPPIGRKAFLVIGKTCAGKTTFSEHVELAHGFHFIEASSIVRDEFRRRAKSDDLTKFAFDWMNLSGFDIVARTILDNYQDRLSSSFVISGFRTLEEIEAIKSELPDVKIVFIEASDRTRYARFFDRRRPTLEVAESRVSFEEFIADSERQWGFGLLRVAPDVADFVIVNEGSLEDFRLQIETLIEGSTTGTGIKSSKVPVDPRRNELFRCLVTLAEASKPLTCREIAQLTSLQGYEIRHNNANKALKAAPELSRRLEGGRVLRYSITDAGRAFIRVYMQKAEG